MTSGPATVVLVAHGSRVEDANDAHRDLARTLADRSGRTVVAAFLELAAPGIPDAIDQAIDGGAGRVVVLPHFLLPGAHTTRDIPAIVADARARHPEVEVIQAPHLGADPAVLDVLVGQLDAIDAFDA